MEQCSWKREIAMNSTSEHNGARPQWCKFPLELKIFWEKDLHISKILSNWVCGCIMSALCFFSQTHLLCYKSTIYAITISNLVFNIFDNSFTIVVLPLPGIPIKTKFLFYLFRCPPKLVFGRPVDLQLKYCHIEF